MASESYFDARTCYEDGLQQGGGDELTAVFSERIATANLRLAELNLCEAESAYARGDSKKAIDHLELVKTLTYDSVLREKADALLHEYSRDDSAVEEHPSAHSCNSCGGSPDCTPADSDNSGHSLPLLEYYELLIHQLPPDQYMRYVGLGEDFAYAFIAASQDEHQNALTALEKCQGAIPHDVYSYEKGKLLHRLGNDSAAEQQLRTAVELNPHNSLAWITLALMLCDGARFQDAVVVIDAMVAQQIMPEQALLLRADIFEATGEHENAVNLYVELLQTPFARTAAEKLYGVLMEIGRDSDAAVIFKKYLNKSCH